MQIDLRNDARTLSKYVRQRVRDYPKYVNEGPGEDEDPVTQITIGYQFDQAGWLALVFDTRPGARSDGEWNSFIEPNCIECDNWCDAFDDSLQNDSAIRLTLPNGSKETLTKNTSIEEVAEYIGNMIRDVLTDLQSKGVFGKLPIAPDCSLVVEEHSGYFGWTDQKTDGETEHDYVARLESNVATKSADNKIAHWIEVLDRIALGKESESEWSFLSTD